MEGEVYYQEDKLNWTMVDWDEIEYPFKDAVEMDAYFCMGMDNQSLNRSRKEGVWEKKKA